MPVNFPMERIFRLSPVPFALFLINMFVVFIVRS